MMTFAWKAGCAGRTHDEATKYSGIGYHTIVVYAEHIESLSAFVVYVTLM